jgi:prepilin peptidase CpaA
MTIEVLKELAAPAVALLVAGIAGISDWRTRRISNRLTVSALMLGMLLNIVLWRWHGLKISAEGAGIAMLVLLPFVLAGGVGAGDWKLMTALGAILGPQQIVKVIIATTLIGGIMAVVQMVRHNRVKQTLSNLVVLIRAISTFQVRSVKWLTLDNPGLMSLPFGVAAAIAMTLFVCAECASRIF